MTMRFFMRLAANNIKKNYKTYVPYIFTCILTVSMYYLMTSLAGNPGVIEMAGGSYMEVILEMGSYIIAIFSCIFLFYTNSFLIKQRKKEFGMFNILGMEKKHLVKVVGMEILYTMLISFGVGLLLAIAVDKVLFLILTKILDGNIVLGFYISVRAIRRTLQVFAVIFFLIFLYSVGQVYIANPIQLLRAGNEGEKEPKTKWVMAFIGVFFLAAGYYIAIAVEDPLSALVFFFIAVVLVIVGTYLLFTAGSIVFLKILKKRPGYYYKTKHFIGVSFMLYRMKQNAVGLANICILSTMVLVMVSSTTSMMVGMNDMIENRYPRDIQVECYGPEESREKALMRAKAFCEEKGVDTQNAVEWTNLQFPAVLKENQYHMTEKYDYDALFQSVYLCFVPVEAYNQMTGNHKVLQDNEVIIYSKEDKFTYDTMKIFDREYFVTETKGNYKGDDIFSSNLGAVDLILVSGVEELEKIDMLQNEAYGENASEKRLTYEFDVEMKKEEEMKFSEELTKALPYSEYNAFVQSKATDGQSYRLLFGSFFFLGSFLGVLFLTATVLIIYYKQMSEGYSDKRRFEIMQKVGMSLSEVKSSIRSQILMVFFLPLVVAGIHVAMAFPLISRLLFLFNMTNIPLYVVCTVICFLIFAVIYAVIYALTARTYYKIVRR